MNGCLPSPGSQDIMAPQAELHLQVLVHFLMALLFPAVCSNYGMDTLWGDTELSLVAPVQVSRIQESSTDYRKFYIHNGAKTMRLRAETK